MQVACTTGPRLAPVVPSRPLGTSTATTGLPEALMAATTSAAIPSRGRDRPAPNRASMIEVGVGKRGRVERLDGLAPALRHCGSVALQRFAAAEQSEAHPVSLLAQEPRRHEAVAAVVAGPADDRDRGPRPRCERDCGVGHGAAGVLHQHEARHAVRRSKGVGTAHLGRCEQFVAGQGFSFLLQFAQHIMRRCGALANVAGLINKSADQEIPEPPILGICLFHGQIHGLPLVACCPVDTQQSYAAQGFSAAQTLACGVLNCRASGQQRLVIEVGR